MSLLAKIDGEREEYCRFEDYERYARHLVRKLRNLRKSSNKSESDILLFNAERAWASAMLNKVAGGKTQKTLNKLRKACKYAKQLEEESRATSETRERLQATLFLDYLLASLAQERGSFAVAILRYSRALLALQNQRSDLISSVETGLRFSIYQNGVEERSINLQRYALKQIANDPSQAEWRALIDDVDPKSLKEEKNEEMINSIQWASRSAQLSNSELAAAISTAVSGRAGLTTNSGPNDYDSVLAAWATALAIIQSSLDKEEDQDAAQELELIKAWTSYYSLLDHIERDKVLLKTVPSREGVLLCDAINKIYTQILALPGLYQAEQQTTIESQRREMRGERCILLAATHGSSLESIALINRALTYFEASSLRRAEIATLLNQSVARFTLASDKRIGVASAKKWFSGDVKQLGRLDPKRLMVKSVTMKPVVFDIAWNYISAEQTSKSVSQQAPRVAQEATNDVSQGKPIESNAPRRGLFGGLFGGR